MRRSMSCGAYTLSMGRGISEADAAIIAAYGCAASRDATRACSLACASARRAPQQELREQRRRPPGAALGRTALISGAGHVEVRPGESLRELGEEGCRGDRATVASADVGEVSEIALELLGVFLGEWQLPAAVVSAAPGFEQLVHQAFVAAHDAGVMMAERDDARPGEGRDVDHRRRAKAPRVVQRVGQDQPTLRIGVEDLDRLSGGAGGDV